MEFKGKTVIVTGAAGTIGKGLAARFCEQGANVFLTDLNQEALDGCCQEVDPSGERAKSLAADVTKADQVKAVVDAALAGFDDRVDVLVNVAGVVAQGKVEEIEEKEWDFVYAVNCKGTFLFIKEVVPVMKRLGGGRIINFSSKSGKTGSALMAHYSSAKAAIIGLTQALAFELASSGINVNCVCPGITAATGVWNSVSSGYVREMDMPMEDIVKQFTAKVPLGRLAEVEDVVAISVFLASKGSGYMTGQAINITGGREMH